MKPIRFQCGVAAAERYPPLKPAEEPLSTPGMT